jgi:hypothetical protein
MTLREFFYVDRPRLETYAVQLPSSRKTQIHKALSAAVMRPELSLTPKVSASYETLNAPVDRYVPIIESLERYASEALNPGTPLNPAGEFVSGVFELSWVYAVSYGAPLFLGLSLHQSAPLLALVGSAENCTAATALNAEQHGPPSSSWPRVVEFLLGSATGQDAGEFDANDEVIAGSMLQTMATLFRDYVGDGRGSISTRRGLFSGSLKGLCRVRRRLSLPAGEVTVLYPIFLERQNE